MTSTPIEVAPLSGRSLQVPAADSMERPVKYLKLQAQGSLHTGVGILRDSSGQILDDSEILGEAGVQPGDTLTLQVRQTMVASRFLGSAFAAIIGDGSVVTWGDPQNGGDSSKVQDQLRHVKAI